MNDTDGLPEALNPLESVSARDLAVLRLVIREEVRGGCADAVKDVKADQDELRAVVCGPADSGGAGLLGRVQILETKATLAQWLAGIALGSSLAAMASLVVVVLTHQVRL